MGCTDGYNARLCRACVRYAFDSDYRLTPYGDTCFVGWGWIDDMGVDIRVEVTI